MQLGWKQMVGDLEGHTAFVASLALSPNKEKPILASAADDRTVRIWDFQSRRQMLVIERPYRRGHRHLLFR
jgi:WD40 repeat protein